MAASDGLREIVLAGRRAEQTARAVAWEGPDAARRELHRIERELDRSRAALRHPDPLAPAPSAPWRRLVDDATRPTGESPPDFDSSTPDPRTPDQRQADADTAIALARLAVLRASREVLTAWSGGTDVRVGPVLHRGSAAARASRGPGSDRTRDAVDAAGRQLGIVLRDRGILMKLVVSFALGLGTLAVVVLTRWDENVEQAPYLALLALSGVIGGVVCTNSLSWDARRVREEMNRGRRLGRLLVSKNIALFLVVGTVGVVLCVLLAWRAGSADALVSALGELTTMMLVWLGVGNMLSVLSPLRVEPLKARFADGTWKPFFLSFAVSYVIGLGVNGVLTWKVWAKRSMAEELGGSWVPVLGLVFSALVLYALLTANAVSLADHPRVRRALRTEVIDTKAATSPPRTAPTPT